MFLVKSLMGWFALALVLALIVSAEVVGNGTLSKVLWWLAAAVTVIAAINTSSYR